MKWFRPNNGLARLFRRDRQVDHSRPRSKAEWQEFRCLADQLSHDPVGGAGVPFGRIDRR